MSNRRYTAELAARRLEELRNEDTDSDVDEDTDCEETNDIESDISSESDDSDSSVSNSPSDGGFVSISRDGTEWHRHPLRHSSTKSPPQNILRHAGGPTRYILQRSDDITDIFLELLDRRNIDDIVEFTNAEATRSGKPNFNLDSVEFIAFIGLCLARGVAKGRNEPLSSFWSDDTGRPMFRETMSRNRFKDIMRFLRFDNKDLRKSRRQEDRFCLIRTVWNRVMNNSGKAYRPHECVTVDEQLLSCKARCSFIQYLPSKPGKFGIKFWLCCDSATYYVLDGFPYVGKEDGRVEVGLGEHVALKLTKDFEGVNVTTDNFFTSQALAGKLLKEKKTLVGTLRFNRKEIPAELKDECKAATKHTSSFRFSETTTMVGYKAKANKEVFLLSSLHLDGHVVDSEKKVPEIIEFYNKTKIGVDKADEMIKFYSSKTGSRRWPLHVFYNIIDICALNAFIIAADTKLYVSSRRDFLFAISRQLCREHGNRRQRPYLSLQLSEVSNFLGKENDLTRRTTCKRCHKNKTKQACISCGLYACGSCSKQICVSCLSK